MSRLLSVKGSSLIVTGSASGLGEATARFFAARGAKVTLLDLDEAKGNAVASSIGSNAAFFKTDVTSEASVKEALAFSAKTFGPLRGAVSCAGIAPAVKVLGKKGVHPLSTFEKTISVNLIGTFNILRLAAEAMSANTFEGTGDRGVIVNTASVAAYDGQIGQTAYAASKGGVVGLTLPAARELGEHRIRVCTIAPGIMGTPMLAGLPQAAQDSLSKVVPYPQRLGDPEEFAALVHHIFENQYLNGEVIRLDGCIRMPPK
jgi:NAD(P)-dependent dehydrogenase (short-subunit alcohol dehydrogenase family)